MKKNDLKTVKVDDTTYSEYHIYNQSLNFENINLFSDNKKHTGVVDISSPKQENAKRTGYLDSILFYSHWKLPLYNPIEITESGVSKKIMAGYYFSPYQQQQGIIQIPINKNVKNLNISYPLKHGESGQIRFKWGRNVCDNTPNKLIVGSTMKDSKNNLLFKVKPTLSLPLQQTVLEKQLCLIVENTTYKTVRVDLLALLSGKKIDGVNFDSPISEYKKGNNIFNRLKVWSDNTGQNMQPLQYVKKGVKLNKKTKLDIFGNGNGIQNINLSSCVSAYQMHLWILETSRDFKFHSDDSYFVDILAGTKVAYYFFNEKKRKLK